MIIRTWRFALLSVLPVLLFAGIDWSRVDLDNPEYFVQGEVVVRLRDGVNLDQIKPLLGAVSMREIGRIEQLNLLFLKLADAGDIREVLGYYSSQPDVLYVEPVAILHAFWTPNDEFFPYQWNFDAGHLNMPAVWDSERGSSSVIIAIMDTGIAFEDYAIPSHEVSEVTSSDGYYHICPDFTSSQFVAGYDFINTDSHPNDEQGHGTHVAGTVAQATNNGIGTAGMAHNSSLMPVRVLDETGSGPSTALAQGITWAADHGADVINMSLGWPAGNDSAGLSAVHEAIIYAQNKGVVIVAAAGNEGVGKVSYPAAFEECIAVSAVDYNDNRAPYSQYGPGIDICAAGGNIEADENGDGYADGILQCTYKYPGDENGGAKVDEFVYPFWQGTSMATPHVAALAALLVSHGVTGVANVKNAIFSTAVDLGASGYDQTYGYGRINPLAALGGAGNNPPNTPKAPSGPSTADVGETVTFSVITSDPEGDQVAYKLDWGDGNTSSWTSFVASGTSQAISHSYSQKGTYSLKAKAKDSKGAESNWSSPASITIGGGGVQIAIPVLQNPLLSQYIDIWVVPTSGTLSSVPDVKVNLNGNEESVSMKPVSGSEAYVGDYTFKESGTATITVTADGSSKSRSFTVGQLTAAGGALSSVDGRLRLEIPEGSLSTPTFFTIIAEDRAPGNSFAPYGITQNKDGLGPAYRIGPSGVVLSLPAILRVRYADEELAGADPSCLVLMRHENGTWTKLSSYIDRENREIVAHLDRLGIFQLASLRGQRTPELPKAVSLALLTPNPTGELVARLSLGYTTSVSLALFDASGRKMRNLLEKTLPPGEHELCWDMVDDLGRSLTQGVYFLRLQTPSLTKTLKVVSCY